MSPNQGQVWNLMTGGIGNPLIVNDFITGTNVNPVNDPTPNGADGRIVLAVPAPTGNAAEDADLRRLALRRRRHPAGGFDGLFVTKDFGQNWTKVRIPTLPPILAAYQPGHPHQRRHPARLPDHGGSQFTQGNYYLTLAVDPTNPNIVYLGGFGGDDYPSDTGLIRVDTTNIWDAHSLVAGSQLHD